MADNEYVKSPKYFHPSYIKNESIILIPICSGKYLFFGIGKVFNVTKGEKFDLVLIEFKPTTEKNRVGARSVIVMGNHPRRQILTLKRGQFCMAYGYAYLVNRESEKEDGTKATYRKWQLYACALQGWHTPTMFDITKMRKDNETEEDKYIDMSESQRDMFENILEQLGNIGDEENNDE